jgi:hypothetical protein
VTVAVVTADHCISTLLTSWFSGEKKRMSGQGLLKSHHGSVALCNTDTIDYELLVMDAGNMNMDWIELAGNGILSHILCPNAER